MEKMLSLIVPVYNEEEVLEVSFEKMDQEMKKIGYPYEIIYVNDGSRDGSMKSLRRIAKENPQVKVRSFSRNFGHQTAVTCGMDAAKGDALIIIDVDLQEGLLLTSANDKNLFLGTCFGEALCST